MLKYSINKDLTINSKDIARRGSTVILMCGKKWWKKERAEGICLITGAYQRQNSSPALLTSENSVVIFINVQFCHMTSIIKVSCLSWFMVVTVTLLELHSFCKQVYKHNLCLRTHITKGRQTTLNIFLQKKFSASKVQMFYIELLIRLSPLQQLNETSIFGGLLTLLWHQF